MAVFTFIETLKRLLAEPALTTRNAVLDSTMLSLLTTRVEALTPDVTTWLSAGDVLTTGDVPAGALAPNVLKNKVALDIDGFEFALSRFRDDVQPQPYKLRRRTPGGVVADTPSDRV